MGTSKKSAKENGRPVFEPTDFQRQMVMKLRAVGVSNRLIAVNLGIAEMTMRKHFKVELEDGIEQVKAGIGSVMVSAALGGNLFAAKYWLSTHGGPEWRVTESRLVSGDPDAAPVRVAFSDMSDDELRREIADLRDRERIASDARAMASAVPHRSNGVEH